MKHSAAFSLLAAWPVSIALACGSHGAAPPTPPSRTTETGRAMLSSHAEVRAELKAPSQAPYNAFTLSGRATQVGIRLTNEGASPLDVSHLRVAFSASREGVTFPCRGPRIAREHEPPSLAQGESFLFERDLECSMPLPGAYEVRVRMFLDAAGAADDLGSISITLAVDDKTKVPTPIPTVAGLYAMMIGEPATRPLSPEAWARGDYHVGITLINASQKGITVGPAKFSLAVYKRKTNLRCADQAEPITTPSGLGPGELGIAKAAVRCAPSVEGDYDLVGSLSLGGNAEVEVGRMVLTVTRDPLLFAPLPLPQGP